MRRATTVLAVCLCAITGCRGGAAQEPYEGVVAGGRAAANIVDEPAPADEPIASEVDIPWTIALLSDAVSPPADAPRPVVVVESESEPADEEPVFEEISVDLQLAVDQRVHEKPPAVKICPGVVKGRS